MEQTLAIRSHEPPSNLARGKTRKDWVAGNHCMEQTLAIRSHELHSILALEKTRKDCELI
jgi:hypothetical protein